MLDLSNLTPFQKRVAKLAADREFRENFGDIACPIHNPNQAWFLARSMSEGQARYFMRKRLWFMVWPESIGQLCVYLNA